MRRLAMMVMVCALGSAASAQDAPEPATDAPAEAGAEEAPEPEPEPAATVTYKLDPSSSFLAVTVYKDPNTLGAGLAHDHAVVASSFDGTVAWNVDDAGACDVKISFPVTALVVDPPGARARVGIDPDDTVGDGAKGQIVSNFSGKHQLNASVFPTISFQSSSCSGTTGSVKVTGDLTIRGVGKTVVAPMKVTADGSSFAASGTLTLAHTDFGFKPFTAGLGALKNQDKLKFVIDVKGSAQ